MHSESDWPLTLSFINSFLLEKNSEDSSRTLESSTRDLKSRILSILAETDEEQKPDRLKDLIKTKLNQLHDHQLNQLILSLLHQHRQDTQSKTTPSSELKHHQPLLLTNRSRFQSRSPQTSSAPSTPPTSARFISNLLTTTTTTFPSIQLQSVDKLNASADEFKPALSRAVSLPFKPTNNHSHHRSLVTSPLAPANSNNHLWAYSPTNYENQQQQHHQSPLQSPRPPSHLNNNHNHFYHHSRPTTPEIPRDPWLKDELEPKNLIIQSTLSPKPLDFSTDPQDDEHQFDLFSPFKSPSLHPITTSMDHNAMEPSCPSALQWGLSPEMAEEMAQFTVWDQSDSEGSQPPTIVHHPAEDSEHGGGGHYQMTAFDELSSTLAGTGVTVSQIDEALHQSGYEISKALDWLLQRHGIFDQASPDQLSHPLHHRLLNIHRSLSPARDPSPIRGPTLLLPADSSRPTSPRFAPLPSDPASSPRRSKASSSTLTDDSPALELNPAHRICRFYLQGCCLRSDCKFSHDVGKAICRFWLKGNCLKGESRCDFLHEIPDLATEQGKEEEAKPKKPAVPKSFADEFPSLNESLAGRRPGAAPSKPSRLCPVALLPDRPIEPSPSLLKLSETYRSKSVEFAARRKECFDLAKECFKAADGAGVKKWSKEADQWNKRLGEEGRSIAGSMIAERNRLMKDAVRERVSDRAQKVDEGPDRMQRGKEMGGGICLGVVQAGPSSGPATAKERTEVMMDLHALQPDDAVYYLEKFLMALKTEGFQGLAYVLLGPDAPEGPDAPRRLTLKPVLAWLERKKFDASSWPLAPLHSDIVCIDPLRKV